MGRMFRFILILIVLMPVSAEAAYTVLFQYGAEICAVETSDTETTMPWQGYGTDKPTNSSATFRDDTNHCSLDFNLASGVTNYVKRSENVTAESHICALAYLTVDTACSSPRKIIELKSGSSTGAFLTTESNGTGKFKLTALYEDSTNQCTGTSTHKSGLFGPGSECTDVSECGEANPGEAACELYPYRDSGKTADAQDFTTGTTYIVGIEQDNSVGGAGEINVKLFGGLPGRVYDLGGGTHKEGQCDTGNFNVGEACGASTDCDSTTDGDGLGTCITTDVITIDDVIFGPNDTAASACEIHLDNFLVVNIASGDCSQVANYRIKDAVPNSDVTTAWGMVTGDGCNSAGEFACVDDTTTGAAPDTNTSRLRRNSAENIHEDVFGLVDVTLTDTCSTTCVQSKIACSIAADCTQTMGGAVSAVSWLHGNSPNGAQFVDTAFEDTSGSRSNISSANMNLHPDTTLRADSYLLVTDPPGADTSWTETNFNAARLSVTYDSTRGTPDCSSGCQTTWEASIAEVLLLLPAPPVPNVLVDTDGDGDITVAFLGNSRMNKLTAGGQFSGLVQAQNTYDGAKGGAEVGDMEANRANLREGSGSGFLHYTTIKGALGKTVDTAVFMWGINSLIAGSGVAAPEILLTCSTNADCTNGTCISNTCSGGVCQGGNITQTICVTNADCSWCSLGQKGYCYDNGGTDEGNPCFCPKNSSWVSDTSDPSYELRCTTRGADFNTTCSVSSDCCCDTNADCTSRSQCTGGTGSGCLGTCDVPTGLLPGEGLTFAANSDFRNRYCNAGCTAASGCSNGWCVSGNALATIEDSYAASIDSFASNNSDVVLVGSPSGKIIMSPLSSKSFGGWEWFGNQMASLRAWTENYATTKGYSYVDGEACFHQCCTDGDLNNCTDSGGIHPNAEGQQCLGDCINALLTDESKTHDGICTASVCSAGKKGTACSVDADCDIWIRRF